MGVVYRAHDRRLDRDLALKCPWPHLADDPAARRRFLREARASSRIAHPTIVPVYEVFEHDGLPWIAMELIDGRPLTADLAAGEPLPLEVVLRHAVDLTDALRAAHAKGVLHRDLKPGNVLVGKDGRARLTDFGLARFYVPPDSAGDTETDTLRLTQEGKLLGTVGYMAPEQLLGAPPDPRSDIFSLGVVLYEICTGRAAFGATSRYDAYQAVIGRQPVPIARLNYEIPRGLERIVRKAIAKNPDERYQEARDLLADLRALKHRIEAGQPDADDEGTVPTLWRSAAMFATAAGLAAIAWAVWTTIAPKPPIVVRVTPRQLTTAPGAEWDPAISPDGTLVAYVSDESGSPDLWLVDSRGGNPIRLTDDPAADASPAWLPDGSAIVFASDRAGGPAVWKVPALGGSPTLLLANASQPAVSPDGTLVAFTREDASGVGRIAVAPIGAADRFRWLTTDRDGLYNHRHPQWSPDGSLISYADANDIWVVPVGGGPARRVTRAAAYAADAVWSADGRHLVYESDRGDTLALWRSAVSGGEPERLTYGSGPESGAAVSRDGSRLAFSTRYADPDIGIRDLRTGAAARFRSALLDVEPALSADGRRVIFGSQRWGGKYAMGIVDLDGLRPSGRPRRLTEWAAANPAISPDGRYVALMRIVDGERHIWILPIGGGAPARLLEGHGIDIEPAWSPDGSRLAMLSNRAGPMNVWIVPMAGGRAAGPPVPLTRGTATDQSPTFSPDGSEVAFARFAGDRVELYAVPSGGGAARRIAETPGAQRLRWISDPYALLVAGTWGGSAIEIREVSPVTGAIEPLRPPVVLGRSDAAFAFDATRDGRILALSEEDDTGDIWLLEGRPGAF